MKMLKHLLLWQKLAILSAGFLAPSVIFGYLNVSDKAALLRVTERELRGAEYLHVLIDVLAPISRHRGQSGAFLSGETSFRDAALASQAKAAEAVAAMDAMDARYAHELGADGKWHSVKAEWLALQQRALTLPSAAEAYRQHSIVMKSIAQLGDTVRDNSELSLDVELATYYMQNVAFALAIDELNDLVTLRGRSTTVAARGTSTRDEEGEMSALRVRIPAMHEKIRAELAKVWGAEAATRSAIEPALKQLEVDTQAFLNLVHTNFLAADSAARAKTSARDTFAAGDKATTALLGLISVTKLELEKYLELRQGQLQASRSMAIALLVLAVAASLTLAWLITRSMTRPMAHAIGVFRSISSGKYDNVIEQSGTDETGQVLRALADMQNKLRSQIEAERHQAAGTARIKSALDTASASVMLADESLKIIYVNSAAQKLFSEAESDFRRDLPGFDASRLAGSDLDALFQSSPQPGQVLANLSSPHTADMRIGNRAMRISASPVSAADGTRIGTVVEWFDRTQEVGAEEEVGAIVKKALEGNLAARIRTDDKTGFFQVLGRGLNELLESVAAMVRQIKHAATEVNRGAEEISAGNANLSQRTEEQSSSLEETASSMEEMTSTVKQNADNAGLANQLATVACNEAEKGGAVVGNAVTAMAEINESSRKIADIIGVIDEIAFQTNLLALNAAVEAARAGEQGRGFAVVAQEVRSLAGRSAVAAKEIKDLIQRSVKKVEDGSVLVTQSGQTLEQIVTSVKKVSNVIAEIAAASREQSSGIEQVNKAVMQMDTMTQQNAALVEEATAASHSMADQARRLNEMMARFQLDLAGERTVAPARTRAPQAAVVSIARAEGRGGR
jgi:methyl-accepting chemotaxis protein